MKDLRFTHTITVTEDDFITMEVYLNEYLEKSNDFEKSLNEAFADMRDDFLFAEDYVRHAIWEYHREDILEEFKKWQKNS